MFFDRDMELSFTLDQPQVTKDLFEKLCGFSSNNDHWDIEYQIPVRARRHKKRRIDKKWLKRYGWKMVKKYAKNMHIMHKTDDTFEFIKEL